jgi:hypothetical protein
MRSEMVVRSFRVALAVPALVVLWLILAASKAALLWIGLLVVVATSLAIVLQITSGKRMRAVADVIDDVEAEPTPAIATQATSAVSFPRPPTRSPQ